MGALFAALQIDLEHCAPISFFPVFPSPSLSLFAWSKEFKNTSSWCFLGVVFYFVTLQTTWFLLKNTVIVICIFCKVLFFGREPALPFGRMALLLEGCTCLFARETSSVEGIEQATSMTHINMVVLMSAG